jgi:hypothetical protein
MNSNLNHRDTESTEFSEFLFHPCFLCGLCVAVVN